MMHFRPIHPDELARFAAVHAQPERNEQIHQYLRQMIAAGSMRPAWCFVAEEAEQFSGRVAFWTLPDMEEPLDLVLLELRWDGDYLTAGAELLRYALAQAHALGVVELGYVFDTPPMRPMWQEFPEQRAKLLDQAGFKLARETLRFDWRAATPLLPGSHRLTFRSLVEVGDAAFVAAIEEVSQGSLDRRIRQEIEQDGPKEAARASFEMYRKFEHDPAWWELAYTSTGELAGLVMPARNPTFPVIAFIGVTPACRGQGYIDDLLARGTATLHAAGAAVIRADTDTYNTPMANAFRRAGYTQFATRREFTISLAGMRPGR